MYDRTGPANPCRLFTSSRSQLLTPGRPITKVRKWGVSNFGTLRTFDSQPTRSDFLGRYPEFPSSPAHLGPFVPVMESPDCRQFQTRGGALPPQAGVSTRHPAPYCRGRSGRFSHREPAAVGQSAPNPLQRAESEAAHPERAECEAHCPDDGHDREHLHPAQLAELTEAV